jgi:MFS family permease
MALTALAPLRRRSYAFAWSSQFVSSVGTWMQATAVGVFMYHSTHNTTWLSLVTLAAWLPGGIGSPLGGVMADRWNRQRWIQIMNVIMAACATTLALLYLTGELSPTLVVVLALIEGFASSAAWSGWQGLLPDLVDRDEIVAAVSLGAAGFNLGRLIGPSLAAVLFAVSSFATCFVANAISFLVVIVAFFFVRSAPRPRIERPFHPLNEFGEGARAAWANPACRSAITTVALVSFILSPFVAFIPAMAKHLVGPHFATATGVLMTAQGLGAVMGAFLIPPIVRRTSRIVVMRACLATFCVSITLYGLSSELALSFVALMVVGAAFVGTLTNLNASVQLHAPLVERSRVLSVYTLALTIAYPLGTLVQGPVAHAVGVVPVTVASGALAGGILASTVALRPQFLGAMGAPAHA